jgi:hypothetical protein
MTTAGACAERSQATSVACTLPSFAVLPHVSCQSFKQLSKPARCQGPGRQRALSAGSIPPTTRGVARRAACKVAILIDTQPSGLTEAANTIVSVAGALVGCQPCGAGHYSRRTARTAAAASPGFCHGRPADTQPSASHTSFKRLLKASGRPSSACGPQVWGT